jgi:hypothetical protein
MSLCIVRGIRVSIATFSTQIDLINDVLQKSLPVYKPIPIYGGDEYVNNYGEGKQSQLYLALQFYNENGLLQGERKIEPLNTLLVDDDSRNIKIAKHDGYCTIEYTPGSSLFDAKISKPIS